MTMPTPQELIKAGVHIGHKKSKWNPRMAPYVFGVRNNVHIIDITKTLEKLNQVVNFLQDLVRKGGVILWVGVKIQSRGVIQKVAQELNMPYVAGRWVGGLFTNFKIIKERLKYFRDLEEQSRTGQLNKYTKKEKLNFERELAKLEREIGGLKNLQSLPQAVFISDVEVEKDALLEAKKAGIPVVAMVDTNADPLLVDWPIPANDDSVASLKLITNTIKEELKILPKSSDELKSS